MGEKYLRKLLVVGMTALVRRARQNSEGDPRLADLLAIKSCLSTPIRSTGRDDARRKPGASWPQYFYAGFGQGRNPDALERANFASTLMALGGETETVKVVNDAGTFGWGELIAIHESDAEALKIADKIKAGLAESSIVNHNTYYECQQEDAELTWKNCFDNTERINYIREYRDQFNFHDLADLIGCVRGKYFSGDTSWLLEQTG